MSGCRSCLGRLFHSVGMAVAKQRSPNWLRDLLTKHVRLSADRRGWRPAAVVVVVLLMSSRVSFFTVDVGSKYRRLQLVVLGLLGRRNSVATCRRHVSCGPEFCKQASTVRRRCVWSTSDSRGDLVRRMFIC